MDLAVEQINSDGGVLGRQLQIKPFVSKGANDIDLARDLTYAIARNPTITALISREGSSLTKPLTIIFEQTNLINLITSATNNNIILPNMKYNFRLIPKNSVMAAASVRFCQIIGCQRVAIIMGRDSYSQELGQAFYDEAIALGIRTAYMKTFFEDRTDFIGILNEAKDANIDAIYFSAWAKAAVQFMKQKELLELKYPIIATDSLDNSQFIDEGRGAAENTITPSIYNETLTHEKNQRFLDSYLAEYGKTPGTWSAQGYDAVYILANAIKSSGSTVPDKIGSAIRYMPQWLGAGGHYQFTYDGELTNRDIFFKRLEVGRFWTIPSIVVNPFKRLSTQEAVAQTFAKANSASANNFGTFSATDKISLPKLQETP